MLTDVMQIEVVRGDITTVEADVLVTAANAALVGGGGVDAAIHSAAGPRLLAALRPLSPCDVGGAVITPAFDLGPSVQWIVHAVGPRYGIDEPADRLLANAYLESISRCDEVDARSVAFPSISTGVYRFPLSEAVQISVATLRAAATQVERCLLVAFDERTRDSWERALG
jgi:O-acetyl-ADP-ribose deacetylase (regulator of RNase III)